MKKATKAIDTIATLTTRKSFWLVVTALLVIWLVWQALTGTKEISETTRVVNRAETRNAVIVDMNDQIRKH